MRKQKNRRTSTNPFVNSLFGIQLGIAGHVFGFRPSEILGIENTARGLNLDMLLAPKVLTVRYQGMRALPELSDQLPDESVGDTAKTISKGRQGLIRAGLKDKVDMKTGKRLK